MDNRKTIYIQNEHLKRIEKELEKYNEENEMNLSFSAFCVFLIKKGETLL